MQQNQLMAVMERASTAHAVMSSLFSTGICIQPAIKLKCKGNVCNMKGFCQIPVHSYKTLDYIVTVWYNIPCSCHHHCCWIRISCGGACSLQMFSTPYPLKWSYAWHCCGTLHPKLIAAHFGIHLVQYSMGQCGSHTSAQVKVWRCWTRHHWCGSQAEGLG